MTDTKYFVRVAGDNLLNDWIEKEKAAAVKFLVGADGIPLHRMQGRYQLLEEIQKQLEAAKKLR